ncbi:uncharacterized protein LOC123545659 [Mercenaria mercenaria]|uniref:uncharacterized protein LOC123545659 n=1 Tax=Mercenaria mercenaria TaxID=6596 RepID=UPI00234F4ACF|nr:uncharacterized protein LOC123545659 [Mercenaria mercenaria]
MLDEANIITILMTLAASFAGSSDIKTTKYDIVNGENEVSTFSQFITSNVAVTETTSKENGRRDLSKDSESLQNVTNNKLETYDQSVRFGKTEAYFTTTGQFKNNVYNGSYSSGNISHISNKHQHNDDSEQGNNDTITTEITNIYNRNIQENEKILSEKVLNQNKHKIPYHIITDVDPVQMLTLDRKKIPLQHHLHLVPMEDEPFGAMMLKNQRYMISVMVPIGVGMIGAVMIVCTVITLRKVASKRIVHTPLDDDVEAERAITSQISSISTEMIDRGFLLFGDDEN